MQHTTLALLAALALATPALADHHAVAEPAAATQAAGAPAVHDDAIDLSGSFDHWHGRAHHNPRVAPTAEQQAAWDADIDRHWSIDPDTGDFVSDGHGAFLSTTFDAGDFELWLDYKILANGDSGIYLRGIPQVQIWDPTQDTQHGNERGSAGLWNNQTHERWPLALADRPTGEWNNLYIRMIGERVTVYLNDTLVVDDTVLENYFDRSIPVPAAGPIQLQTHGNESRFRNVRYRALDAHAANTHLLPANDTGEWTSLFDGETTEPWIGDASVVDGTLVHRAGVLRLPDEYEDFRFAFQFKLPEGGNNGFIFRYPGEGNPSYTGLELQILDNDAPQYAELQPYQYHGSLYGLVPAQRGYTRPAGEWNTQIITVNDGHVTVELNGTVINRADLGTLTSEQHTGLDHPAGFIGFTGHGDNVAFRNLMVQRLDD